MSRLTDIRFLTMVHYSLACVRQAVYRGDKPITGAAAAGKEQQTFYCLKGPNGQKSSPSAVSDHWF